MNCWAPISFFDIAVSFYRDAATVMLSGQVADGFTTILAGELVHIYIFFSVFFLLTNWYAKHTYLDTVKLKQ